MARRSPERSRWHARTACLVVRRRHDLAEVPRMARRHPQRRPVSFRRPGDVMTPPTRDVRTALMISDGRWALTVNFNQRLT